jgi:DNA-binding CsgD family transcriptional regulator
MLDIAQKLERIDCLGEFKVRLEESLAAVGFEFFIYVSVDENRQNPIFATNISDLYADETQVFDPFLDHCCKTYQHTFTGPEFISEYPYMSPEDFEFIRAISERTGFSAGIGVPVRLIGSGRFGGFNLGTDLKRSDFEKFIEPLLSELKLFCLLAHRKLEELSFELDNIQDHSSVLTVSDPENTIADLTPREKDVLLFLAKGFSRKEIAALCRISHHTVADYLKSIYKKIAVNNKAEATLVAVRIGLL